MYVQELIFTLQRFWADRGCVVEQPVDVEVGAGTFHPATFLKVLGPEPWNAAFAQFCRRPSDGRYGENPMRGGAYYQFQVGMKPSPPNIQDLYLDSLRTIATEAYAAGSADGVNAGAMAAARAVFAQMTEEVRRVG